MSTDQAVVVWGELLWDRFPDGDQLGGAPANVAWHLAQAGGWARLVTRVGDDVLGKRALERLDDVVDTSLVQIDRERPTGEVTVTLDGGEARYRLVLGRAWERIECTAETREALGEAGVLIYGTLAQRTPEGLASWRTAAAVASSTCLRVCDLNLRPADREAPPLTAIRETLAAADVVKLNDLEATLLREWLGWADPVATLRAERDRVIVLTHGARGSTLFGSGGDQDPIEIAGIPARPGGDNVGCGDSYLAILVHGMTLGWDLATSGRAATRWASAVAGARGATPTFSDEQIAELLEVA